MTTKNDPSTNRPTDKPITKTLPVTFNKRV